MAKPEKTNAAATSAEVDTRRPFERFVEEMKRVAALTSTDNLAFDIAADVIDEIAGAMSVEDILNAGAGFKGEDMVKIPFAVELLTLHPTKLEKSLGVYLNVEYVGSDGRKGRFTCGAANVVAKLWALNKLGTFDPNTPPRWFVITSRPTENGNLLDIKEYTGKKS